MNPSTKTRAAILSPRLAARCISVLFLALFAWSLATLLTHTPFFQDAERWGFDLLVNHSPSKAASPNIVIVDFDDSSVDSLHVFPVPRSVIADTISKVSKGQPDLIALDMLLSESRGAVEDHKLQLAMSAASNVVVVSTFGSNKTPVSTPLPEYCEIDPQQVSQCGSGAAMAVGFGNLRLDEDGFVRRTIILPEKGYPVLPFAVTVASNYLHQPLRSCQHGAVCLGPMTIFLDDSGLNAALMSNWVTHATEMIPALKLLTGQMNVNSLKGKIVIIGQSSAAGNDRYLTPLFRVRQPDGSRRLVSGSEIHAVAIRMLLEGSSVRVVTDYSLLWLRLGCVLFTVGVVLHLRPTYSITLVLINMIGIYATALWMLSVFQIWIKLVAIEGGIILAVPLALGYRFLEERWLKGQALAERKQLMTIFSRYVSPEVAEEIWHRRDEFALAGETRMATVLFSDIRNFTALTVGRPPSEVLRWLNEYLTAMEYTIKSHGGFLNKFIGDGIMVVFGVPLTEGPRVDAAKATATALEMHAQLERLNQAHAADSQFPQLKIGVGIHSGLVMAGSVGSTDRLEYSVIGETVNLASRLESLTKNFNVGTVISRETYLLVMDEFSCQELPAVEVRGFEEPIRVYTVLSKIDN